MTAADPVALLKRYHAALTRLDIDAAIAMFADDAQYRSPGVGGALAGKAAIAAAFRRYFAEYPDQQATDDEVMLLSPDTAASRWRLTAASTLTGLRSERRGLERVTIGADGLITLIEVEDL